MNTKAIIRSILCLLLAVLPILSLTACNGEKKAEQEYQTSLAELVDGLGQKSEALNKAVTTFAASVAEADRAAVLDAVTALNNAFQELAAVEAPKKYADAWEKLKKCAVTAQEGAEVYQMEFTAVTAETFDEAFVERVTRGDDLIRNATDGVLAATKEFVPPSSPDGGGASAVSSDLGEPTSTAG